MCLLIFAYKSHPRYPLLLAANRDEFHSRPTRAAHFWEEYPDLLAGKDLEAGGTWMGITGKGRFAAITNLRDPARTAPAERSRGELPLEFLTGRESPPVYLRRVAARAGDYAGFNLLVRDSGGLWYYSNSPAGIESGPEQLKPGVYGLSNAMLDTPWPKVIQGKSVLRSALGGRISHPQLAGAVNNRELAPIEALHQEGLSGEMDQLLSAQFIVNPGYGTRATTTVWLEESGLASWRETSFDPQGQETGVITEQLTLA